MAEKKCPEISVIVPVYKVEKYLNECINSILAQTFAQFELILVDDGSPDGCPALCDAAALRDDRVRVIHQKNGGVGAARNTGLDAAKGKWITFVDSDDTVAPRYLEAMYRKAVAEQADAAVCDFRLTDESGKDKHRVERLIKDETLTRHEVLSKMMLAPFPGMCCKLYRTELIGAHRFGNRTIGEDATFQVEVFSEANKVVCIAQALYDYRQVTEIKP
mgnify:FL=1